MSETELSYLSPECLENGRSYAGLVGEIPSLFGSAMRSLISDAEKGGQLTQSSLFLAERIVRGPTLMAPLLHAALTLIPECAPAPSSATARDVIRAYKPAELAAMIGLVYLFRRIRKMCAAHESWNESERELQTKVEIGYEVGRAIPKIGPAYGIIASSFPILANALFLNHDPKGHSKYRLHLKKKGVHCDLDWEMTQWACTRMHISACFVQALGFGVATSDALLRSACPKIISSDAPSESVERFQTASIWIDALRYQGTVPDITHKGAFYPLKDALASLNSAIEDIRQLGSRSQFLIRSLEDLNTDDAVLDGKEESSAE